MKLPREGMGIEGVGGVGAVVHGTGVVLHEALGRAVDIGAPVVEGILEGMACGSLCRVTAPALLLEGTAKGVCAAGAAAHRDGVQRAVAALAADMAAVLHVAVDGMVGFFVHKK